jgi:hypothetical protein
MTNTKTSMGPTVSSSKKSLKAVLLYIFGLLITAVGGPVAAPFLKVFFNQYGAKAYLFSYVIFCAVFTLVNPLAGAMMFSFVLSVFIYALLEKRGFPYFQAYLWGLMLPLTMIGLLIASATDWSIGNLHQILTSTVQLLAEKMQKEGLKTDQINVEMIVRLLPGAVISFYVIGIGSAVALERKAHALFGYHYERYVSQLKPLEFRLPDWLIWIGLISMAMAVSGQLTVFEGMEESKLLSLLGLIGQNLCLVLATIYFFQGLAILEVYLAALQAGPFARFFAYFALVLNLVLVLSAIGFIDYWLDFRKRLRKQTEKQRRTI